MIRLRYLILAFALLPVGLAEQALGDRVTKSVGLLRAGARVDEGWLLVPPYYQSRRKVKEHVQVEIRGRYVMVTTKRPIFETYDAVGVTRGNSSTSIGGIGKIKKRRVVGYKEVEVKRWENDPDGPETRTVTKAVYDTESTKIRVPHLYTGFFGANGMAIDTLVALGVPPDDEQFSNSIRVLADFATAYGLPDNTFDLAWLAIGFSAVADRSEYNKQLASQAINKLLLGQIQDPAAAGLWGPTCINPALIAAMLQHELDFMEREIEPLVAKQKKAKPADREAIQETIDAAQARLQKLRRRYANVSTLGHSLKDASGAIQHLKGNGMSTIGGMPLEKAKTNGLAANILQEQVADIESTATALYALSIAADRGLLPHAPDIPMDGKRPLIKYPSTTQIVTAAANAVMKRQHREKGWNEFNIWLPIADFATLLPEAAESAKTAALSAEVTPACQLHGARALLSAYAILGQDPSSLAPRMTLATKGALPFLQKWVADEAEGIKSGVRMPGDLLLFAEPLRTQSPELAQLWPSLQQRLAETWAEPVKPGLHIAASSSHQEIQIWRRQLLHAKKKTPKPFDPGSVLRHSHMLNSPFRFYDRERVGSLLALRALAMQTASAPVAGAWAWDGKPLRRSRLDRALATVSESRAELASASSLPALLTAEALGSLDAVFVSGSGHFKPAESASIEVLKAFAEGGGLLVVEAPASAAGMAFLSQISKAIFGTATRIDTVKVGAQKVYGVAGDDTPRAILLPLGPKTAKLKLAQSANSASAIIATALGERLPPAYRLLDWAAILEHEADSPDFEATKAWGDQSPSPK